MKLLFPLRPIQMIDVSFQLMRKSFVRNMFIALCICLPIQSVVWILQIYLDQTSNSDYVGRLIYVMLVFQFGVFGLTLCMVSNVLSSTTSRTYTRELLGQTYNTKFTSTRLFVAIYHVSIQTGFVLFLIGIRYVLGQSMIDSDANALSFLALIILSVPWVICTLLLGFMVPVSTSEGLRFGQAFKRASSINRYHFFKLFGAYCSIVFVSMLLVAPSLAMLQIVIANNVIKSSAGSLAYTNLNIAIVVSIISVIYSYLLTVAYFNARIENEGFDITFTLSELESERRSRGKLLNLVQR